MIDSNRIKLFFKIVFSSPEPKGQVSFSDHDLSIVNCSHFLLLFKNHQTNFNQTWYKAFLGEGDSKLFKFVQRKGPTLFQGEIILKKYLIVGKISKCLLQNNWAYFYQLGT